VFWFKNVASRIEAEDLKDVVHCPEQLLRIMPDLLDVLCCLGLLLKKIDQQIAVC
jgi:hypothetical protein